MTDLETIAIAKAIKSAVLKTASGNLEPSDDRQYVDVTARFTGWIKKGENYMRTPTVSIPWLDAMAIAIHDAGITGQAAVNAIMRGVTQAMNQDDSIKRILKGMRENLESAEGKIRAGLDDLPEVECQGPCTSSIETTEIETVPA